MAAIMTGDTSTQGAELAALIATLADSKRFLGERYAEWCTAAPSLESAVAAAAMAQDEIGHARSFYPLLQDVAGASAETEPETRSTFAVIDFLRAPFQGWTDFVAANFLFDTALSVLLESARDSSLKGLSQRARRILEEEPLHWLHAEGWVRRLATLGPGVRAALIGSLRRIDPEARAWFNISTPELTAAGILTDGADSLRQAYLARVSPVLEAAGLPGL